jgi:hypothetical protein
MGASTFIVRGEGTSAKEVFSYLVSDAKHEYGHGGYTGTIAEKKSFIKINASPLNSYGEALEMAESLLDEADERVDDKWGPAGCISYREGNEVKFIFFGVASS